MPRANRISSPGYVWHLTHRCHEKLFLLRFRMDRRRWRHWLFEARRRYGLSVLNYIVTCNHIHLLVLDNGNDEIARSMQLVAGRTAQEYNQRKCRRGAFWEDRYHATAVATDHHFLRCMTYIDLNMVRAGVVNHPADWDVSGYSEIQNPWKRKGVIDFVALRRLLNTDSNGRLAINLRLAVEQQTTASVREGAWTEAVGVGGEDFLENLKESIGPSARHRHIGNNNALRILREDADSYFANTPPKTAI